MKNIILTSNGFINSSPRSKEIDELFKTIANGKKVMILGNATLGGSNASQREPVKSNFENVGAKKVATTNVKEILKQFLKSGGIYIGESAGI